MSLDNLFNIVFPMTGCGRYDDVNHCAQSKANNLNCYTDQKDNSFHYFQMHDMYYTSDSHFSSDSSSAFSFK